MKVCGTTSNINTFWNSKYACHELRTVDAVPAFKWELYTFPPYISEAMDSYSC